MKSFVNLTQALSEVTSKGVNSTFNINRLKSEIQAMQFTPDAGGGGGPTYGAILTAVIAQANVLGYTLPNATTLAAIDALITSFGTTINQLDWLYILALNDASLQNFASLNYINPSLYQMTYVSSPSYSIRGLRGNGTTSYGDTNFNPATNGVNYTLNSASRFLYLETIPSTGTKMDGALTTNNRNDLNYSASSTANRINSGGNILSSAVDTTGTGYKAIDRQSNTAVSIYNETLKSDRTQSAVALLSENQTIGKNGNSFSNSEIGLYGGGGSLSQAQHLNNRSSYLTYRTAIGL